MIRPPPKSTLFPYTTLSRSSTAAGQNALRAAAAARPAQPRPVPPPHPVHDPAWLSPPRETRRDRKSTRLNSSHLVISYAVFCLKKKKNPPAHNRGPGRTTDV